MRPHVWHRGAPPPPRGCSTPLRASSAGLLQLALRTGYSDVLQFLVPRDYPQRCQGALDCLFSGRTITAQMTIDVTGVPLRPLALSNILDLTPTPAGSGDSWSGSLQLQVTPDMAFFVTQRVIRTPALMPGAQYRVALLTTSNGWRDLRVVVALEYVPS
jgi:hypothetical protein